MKIEKRQLVKHINKVYRNWWVKSNKLKEGLFKASCFRNLFVHYKNVFVFVDKRILFLKECNKVNTWEEALMPNFPLAKIKTLQDNIKDAIIERTCKILNISLSLFKHANESLISCYRKSNLQVRTTYLKGCCIMFYSFNSKCMHYSKNSK